MALTIQQAQHTLQEILYKHHSINTSQDSWWLLEKTLHKPFSYLLSHPKQLLTESEEEALNSIILDLKNYKPLGYILESMPFLDLDLIMRPPTLIARPETEYWCSLLIEQLKKLPTDTVTILDMCTGSGCIGLSLAKSFPQAHVYAIDIAETACLLAEENKQRNNIENFTIIQSDLFAQVPLLSFDLIVSNPPYISNDEYITLEKSVLNWEDKGALVAAEDGFGLIKDIAKIAPLYLNQNSPLQAAKIAQLWIEIGYAQGNKAAQILDEAGLIGVEIVPDLNQQDRIVRATVKKHDHSSIQ